MTRLVGIARGEIRGFGIPGDERLAPRPQRDSIPPIFTTPPEVGGVEESGSA